MILIQIKVTNFIATHPDGPIIEVTLFTSIPSQYMVTSNPCHAVLRAFRGVTETQELNKIAPGLVGQNFEAILEAPRGNNTILISIPAT